MEAHDLERVRRSLAMLPPGATDSVMSREEAMALVAELAEVRGRLERLRGTLREVLADLED